MEACFRIPLLGRSHDLLDLIERQGSRKLIPDRAIVIDDEGRLVTEPRHNMRKPPVFGLGVPDRAVHDYAGYLDGHYWPPASSALFPRETAAACGNFETLPYQVEDTLLFLRLSTKGAMWFTVSGRAGKDRIL